jgi:cytoskeletal protein RodZ
MRTLIRLILMLVVVVFVGALLLGWWPAGLLRDPRSASPTPSVGTNGTIDPARARERGAELGEKAAIATQKFQETVAEATLTTKIKAKMALDDTLKARKIDVSTTGSTVTVSGEVPTSAARDRALALARETAGVSVVVDHLEIVAR